MIEEILGRKFINGLIKADWVNGDFWCGTNLVGEQTWYWSIYNHESKLLIKKGKIINKKDYNYVPCIYKDENKLLDFILQTFDWSAFPVNSTLQFEVELSIDNWGKIDSMKVLRSNNPNFNHEIIKGLNQLSCWSVYYREGVIFNSKDWIDMEITYDKIKKYVR
jgi:hypothetical protein